MWWRTRMQNTKTNLSFKKYKLTCPEAELVHERSSIKGGLFFLNSHSFLQQKILLWQTKAQRKMKIAIVLAVILVVAAAAPQIGLNPAAGLFNRPLGIKKLSTFFI